MDTGTVSIILLALVIAIIFVYSKIAKKNRETNQFGAELENEGLNVIDAIVDSPSVTIPIDSLTEFMTKVREHNQDTVYRTRGGYHVFNADMTISWAWSAWGW